MKRSLKRIALALLAIVTPCLAWAAEEITEVIAINFGSELNTANTTTALGYVSSDNSKGDQVTLDKWNNVSGKEGTDVSVKGAMIENATYSLTFNSPNTWNSGVDKTNVIGQLTYTYLDVSNTGGDVPNITLAGMPVTGYDVAVILSGDGGTFGGVTVNGTTYIGDTDAGTTIAGNAAWGTRVGNTETLAEGTNVIYVPAQRATSLSITGLATTSSARSSIAGLMVFFREVAVSEATVSNETTTTSEIVWTQELTESSEAILTAETEAMLEMDAPIAVARLITQGSKITFTALEENAKSLTANSVVINADTDVSGITASLGAVTIAAGKTLTIGANTTYASIAGAGTLLCENRLPASATGLTSNTTWTGTVKIDYPDIQVTNINLSTYGNVDSIIELGNIGSDSKNSYFANSNFEVLSDIVLSGAVHIRDGFSGKTYTFSGDLRSKSDTEKGSFNFNRTAGSNTWIFRGDLSGFKGEFNVGTTEACAKFFYFVGPETTASDCEQGCFLVDGTTAVLNGTYVTASDKTMTVKSDAGIKGSGELLTELVLEAGATVDLTNGLTASKVTLPATGDVAIKVSSLPTAGAPITIFGDDATATNTDTAILEDADGNKCVATIATASSGTGIVATHFGEMVAAPEITVSESVSLSTALGNNRLDVDNLETLTVTFTAEGQVFTFDNTDPLNFTSITVNGEYAGTIQMGDSAAAVTTTSTKLNTTVTFDADSNLTLGTVSGDGQLVVAENQTLTLSANNTYTGGTEIAEGATLTITNANALGSGNTSGAGTLKCVEVLPANTTGLTNDTWTGVVEFAEVSLAGCNFDDYGNEQSIVRLNGANGYTAQSASEGTQMSTNIEIGANGLTINNANSGQLAIVTGALTGAGNLTMSATAGSGARIATRLVFAGDTTGFRGDIQVNSGETNRAPAVIFGTASNGNTKSPFDLTLGDTNPIAGYNPNGKIAVAPGATANVVGEWTATQGVNVYGTIGGTGTIGSALILNDDATIDATAGALTVSGAVTLGTVTAKVAGTATVGDTILTCATEGLDLTKITIDGVDGMVAAANADGTAIVLALDVVNTASANGVEYATIAEAVNAVKTATNKTVTIIANTAEAVVLPQGVTLTVAENVEYTGAVTDEYGTTINLVDGAYSCPVYQAAITVDEKTTGYASLQAAVDAAQNGATINVLTMLTLTDTVTLNDAAKAITIDLNASMHSSTAATAIQVTNGTLTLQNGGIMATGVVVQLGTKNGNPVTTSKLVVLDGCSLMSTNYALVGEEYVFDGNNVVRMFGNATLETAGILSTNSTNYAAIQGSGGDLTANTAITITGGTVTSTNNHAIYHPQAGTLTITGGTISGVTGIEMRAGELEMYSGTVTATGAYKTPDANNSGSTVTGAAIALSQHTTGEAVYAAIAGGTVTATGTDGKTLVVANTTAADPVSVFAAINTNAVTIDTTKVAVLIPTLMTVTNGNGFFVTPIVATIGETKYPSLPLAFAAANANATADEITIAANAFIELDAAIEVTTKVTLNLNGAIIMMTEKDEAGDGIFHVKAGGDLTINGEGTLVPLAGTYDGKTFTPSNDYHMAIWADGGMVTIKGGTYNNLGATGDNVSLISATNNGSVEITGGRFLCETPTTTLNSDEGSTIVVKGGSFRAYDPAKIETEPESSGITSWVADGYYTSSTEEKINEETETFVTWYHVKAAEVPEAMGDTNLSEPAKNALIDAAVEAKTSITFVVAGDGQDAATIDAALALFDDIVTVDTTTGVATVDWDFGISDITVNRNENGTLAGTVDIMATVKNKKGNDNAGYAAGVTVVLVDTATKDDEATIASAGSLAGGVATFKDVSISDLQGKKLKVKVKNNN